MVAEVSEIAWGRNKLNNFKKREEIYLTSVLS